MDEYKTHNSPFSLDDDDDADAKDTLRLLAADGQEFAVELDSLVRNCAYIRNMLELDPYTTTIPLQALTSTSLEKIITWLNYHQAIPSKSIPIPLPTSNLKDIVGVWDYNFVDCDLELLFDVLLAANFLGAEDLLQLCCAKLGSMMIEKTPKQIRETFGICENFTQQEEAEILNAYSEFLPNKMHL